MEEEKRSEKSSSRSSHGNQLETRKANKSLWLMKCPPGVSFSGSPDADPDQPHIAKVIVSIDPCSNNDDPEVTLELAAATNDDPESNAPKSYSMNMTKDFVPMCLFSETSDGRVAVEGKVIDKFEMKPHIENMGNYGKFYRERTMKSNAKTRKLKVLENDHGEYMIARPTIGGSSLGSTSKDKKKAKAMAPKKVSSEVGRRIRGDRGEMETRIFKLFERQPIWSLRQLIAETNQPELFLKEIIRDMCFYNKLGTENPGTYELKPEYKVAKQQEPPQNDDQGSTIKEEEEPMNTNSSN